MQQDILFKYPRKVIDFFTGGACGNIAHYINSLTGWDIYGIYFGRGGVPSHYVVNVPGRGFVDIIGLRSERSIIDDWFFHKDNEDNQDIIVEKVDPETMDNPDYYDDIKSCSITDYEMTRKYALDIIDKLGYTIQT